MSWPLVPIGRYVEKVRTWNPATSALGTFKYVDLSSVDKSGKMIDLAAVEDISTADAPSRARQVVMTGDILVSTVRPNLNGVAEVPAELNGATASTGYCILRAEEITLHGRYLYYWVQTAYFIADMMSKATGANYPAVSDKIIRESKVPLPPLPEQKRIAAILDKADAIRRKRQQTIQLADDFLRAVFLDMFGEFVTSSGYASSQKYKLLELVDYIDYRGKTPQKSESGIPLITAKNVKSGYVDDEPREFIPEENYDAWMTRGFPRKNDLLFTTEAPLGNVALLGEYEKVAIGQRLVALRSKGKVTHEYLLFLLLHPFIQDLIYARSSGSTVKGIRTKELYAIELPVPDMQKQKEFSDIYWKSKTLTSNQESARQLEELNFSALSQKAFAGQL